ncbi:hypothetical protein AB4Z10_15135 [Bosea sp. RAF48]|uniref:hypothetical protein n=1 Tax=Bosea sp. RAF48 TaxID=3237480 RepID=UPI003F92BC8B
MAVICSSAAIAATSIAAALFSGAVAPGAWSGEILSLVLAASTSLAVAGAAALDS